MPNTKNTLLRKASLFYAAMGIIAVIWILFSDIEVHIFGTKGLLLSYLMAFLVFALSMILSLYAPWAEELEKIFAELLTPLSLPTILGLSLLSGVSEELLFRGAIQNQFGLIIASILFGLVHFPINKKMVPWTLMAVVMGFVLGLLYLYSGNLLAPISLHFLINFLNIWAINQKYMKF